MRAAPGVLAASLLAFSAGVLAGRRWPAARTRCARTPGPAPALDPERLADDLHDVVTHRLTTMVVQADAALTGPAGRSPQTAAALAAIAASGREALAELRDLLGRLHPEPAPTRPPPGLADLPLLLELAGGPARRVALSVQGEPRPLPPQVQLELYRVVQESVTNGLRHAGAVAGVVTIRYGDRAVELQVDTDAPAALPLRARPGGRGRGGMARRAAALGGRLTAGPRPDGGYRVLLRLPHPGPP